MRWRMMHRVRLFSLYFTYLWRLRCAPLHTRPTHRTRPFTYRFWLEIIFVTFARCSPFGRLFFWRIGLKRKKESFISGLAPLPTGQFVLFYVSFCCCCCWCAVPSFSDTRMCARKRLLWNGTHHIASQSGYYYMYCIHWIQFSRRNSNYNSCSLCAPRCVRACVAGIKCM